MKQCAGCAKNLSTKKFSKDSRTRDNLSTRCYSCQGIALPGAVEKTCVMCDTVKGLDEFSRDLQSVDLHRKICKSCGSKSAKWWQQANPQRFAQYGKQWRVAHKDASRTSARRYHLKKQYDITPEQYWELFDQQKRVCAICGGKPRTKNLHVDHDHKTGKVRGLLCSSCNSRLLPILEHHPDRIFAAFNYLKNPPFAS